MTYPFSQCFLNESWAWQMRILPEKALNFFRQNSAFKSSDINGNLTHIITGDL